MGRKKQMNTGNIEIGTSLSISNAAMLHDKLLAAYKEADRLTINLNGVTDCDTAGIQLLYSLKKSCIDAGKEISLINPSDAVNDALNRMSMTCETLGC